MRITGAFRIKVQIVDAYLKDCCCKAEGVKLPALIKDLLPVDHRTIMACKKKDIADLTDTKTAVIKVF